MGSDSTCPARLLRVSEQHGSGRSDGRGLSATDTGDRPHTQAGVVSSYQAQSEGRYSNFSACAWAMACVRLFTPSF